MKNRDGSYFSRDGWRFSRNHRYGGFSELDRSWVSDTGRSSDWRPGLVVVFSGLLRTRS